MSFLLASISFWSDFFSFIYLFKYCGNFSLFPDMGCSVVHSVLFWVLFEFSYLVWA